LVLCVCVTPLWLVVQLKLEDEGWLRSSIFRTADTVLKKLGEGGKGIAFKARDTALNRVMAIKMLKSAVAGEGPHSRFMTEAQAMAKLNHPNIVFDS
jgi:hypothetical protein